MKTTQFLLLTLTGILLMSITGCGLRDEKSKGKGLNLFSVNRDIELGAQVAAEIDGNPQQYPLLDSASNVEAYKLIYKVRDEILNSGQVDYRDEFSWRLRIIKDDSTLNAFCTPGGYIYVYTGILKFLDNEAQLAGVMGHEIAHADQRHSTRQMTKIYGVQVLLEILAGNQQMLKEITAGLVSLKFSRSHETEADEYSVKYLCPTKYDAAGGAGFFKKIEEQGGQRPPEFLSTHPNPSNRIANFYKTKEVSGCKGAFDNAAEYRRIVDRL